MQSESKPEVVVGVLVFKEDKVLLGYREMGDGSGEYAGPGGHLNFGETLEECAERKVLEETGMKVKNVRVLSFLNALHWEGAHYLDIEATAEWVDGEPVAPEGNSITKWDWYDLDDLPEALIIGDKNGLEALKTGQVYFGTVK